MFSERQAQLATNFFERLLTHTRGEWARRPFLLPKFQRNIVRDLWGTLRTDGLRQYRTAYIEEPKKNGKSELVAGLGLLGFFVDDEPGAEIYLAATTRDQASIIFRTAAQMVRNQPPLRDRCRIVDSTKTIFLKEDPTSFLKAISADAGTQDGINPHIVLFDELHRQRTRDLHSVLKYGMATRRQPLMIEITTAGIEGESPVCWEEHEYARQILNGTFKDPTFYPVIYALDKDEDWTNEGEPASEGKPATGWYKANPALGHFLPVEVMRRECEQAKRLPSAQNEFRRFRLNQWVSQETRWIPLSEWDHCGEPFDQNALVGKTCCGALDLSTVQDLTAFLLDFPSPFGGDDKHDYLLAKFYLPEADLHERCLRDRVPYDVWAKQGLLTLTPGNYIDHGFIRQDVLRARDLYDLREVAFDPQFAQQLAAELTAENIPTVKHGQGCTAMNEPCRQFETAVLARELRHGGHPILRWNMDCTTIYQNAMGLIKPVKPDRLKSSKRIDGITAAIMAHSRAKASAGPAPEPRAYLL
jgi:phage terminase large subunit-like protein